MRRQCICVSCRVSCDEMDRSESQSLPSPGRMMVVYRKASRGNLMPLELRAAWVLDEDTQDCAFLRVVNLLAA